MTGRRSAFVACGTMVVFVGLLAAGQVALKKPKSKFAELSRPAQITELDLRLLEVRISTLEGKLGTGLQSSAFDTCCAHYWYDPIKDKIIGRLLIGREELSHESFDQLRKKLQEDGEMIAVRAATELKLSSGVDTELNDDFETEFVTWDKEKNGCFRVFAVYRLGHVELKGPQRSPMLELGKIGPHRLDGCLYYYPLGLRFTPAKR